MALAFLLTLPGVPFLYYGDEIGMRYLRVPTKEGGYVRTGSRTPMQWKRGKNLGFSTCRKNKLYLPVDPSPDAPTVEEQERDPASLLNTVRAVLCLRRQWDDLKADGAFEVVRGEAEGPFVYRRGNLMLAVNPSGREVSVSVNADMRKTLLKIGEGSWNDGLLSIGAQSFFIGTVSMT